MHIIQYEIYNYKLIEQVKIYLDKLIQFMHIMLHMKVITATLFFLMKIDLDKLTSYGHCAL